jgi:hypothetical protein
MDIVRHKLVDRNDLKEAAKIDSLGVHLYLFFSELAIVM